MCVCVFFCVCWLFSSLKGPQWLICLNHDGQDPSGFPRLLLIPSHQHEMLIVRQSGSRRLFGLCVPYRHRFFAWVFEVLDFLTIHLRSSSSLTRKSILLGCCCALYISESHLWCSEPDTSSAKYHCANPRGKANTQRDQKKKKKVLIARIIQDGCNCRTDYTFQSKKKERKKKTLITGY